jgi:hypothetical protein
MKRVFISFRHEDKQQVNGLRLLAANQKFDIEFYDESVRAAIDSTNAAYIRSKILLPSPDGCGWISGRF